AWTDNSGNAWIFGGIGSGGVQNGQYQIGGLDDVFQFGFTLFSAAGSTAAPSVISLAQDAAALAINEAGLRIGSVARQASDTIPAGTVLSQSVSPGTGVGSGSVINLVVSSGPALTAVPNVVGLGQSSATDGVATAGLAADVMNQSSTTVSSGLVISQVPVGG